MMDDIHMNGLTSSGRVTEKQSSAFIDVVLDVSKQLSEKRIDVDDLLIEIDPKDMPRLTTINRNKRHGN